MSFWFYKMYRTQQFHFSYNLPKKKMFKITFTVIKKRSRLNCFVFFSNSFQKQINVRQISSLFSFIFLSSLTRPVSFQMQCIEKKMVKAPKIIYIGKKSLFIEFFSFSVSFIDSFKKDFVFFHFLILKSLKLKYIYILSSSKNHIMYCQ